MRLVRLYANKLFKNIKFNPHFNVVLGEILDPNDPTKDTHNLGKSSLIQVIDFMLLKEIDKNHLFEKFKGKFAEHIFYIEIQLNSGEYLVMKRSITHKTKISFKINDSRLDKFEQSIEWDEINVSIRKAKKKFDELLAFDVMKEENYRSSVTYFLRSQYDYRDVYQLSKFTIGKHKTWKPFLFSLLGFDGNLLMAKYDEEDEKEVLELSIDKIKQQYIIKSDEFDKLQGVIDIRTEEKVAIEKDIDNFQFYTKDVEMNRELLEEIDTKVSSLNTLRYNITYEIEQIEKSISNRIASIDIQELQGLYKEVQILFPENIIKGYEELEQFNRKISEEREKYLKARHENLKKQWEEVERVLVKHDQQKAQILSVLKDQDSYSKFKTYQKDLVKIESDIVRLQEKLANLGKVGDLEELVKKHQAKIDKQIKIIKQSIAKGNDDYRQIRKSFNEAIKIVLSTPAIISITQNRGGNVEFLAEIQDPENMEVTAEGYGTTYKKLLCAAFDLSLLTVYRNRSFYRFVYHDGILEGLDDRKKKNLLKMLREICRDRDVQYILTVIDSDFPKDTTGRIIPFAPEETTLRLNGESEQGLLFEMSF